MKYTTLNSYLKNTFGCKVYKLAQTATERSEHAAVFFVRAAEAVNLPKARKKA